MIDDSNLIRRKPDLITADADGESIVLNSNTGMFFQLNVSAARIWDLLETGQRLPGLVTAMTARFEIDPAQCRAEIVTMLEDLRERGLVEIV